jgi:predicted transposase YdaD
MATLSQAYLEWEQRTRAEGEQRGLERERALVIRQLTRQIGEISTSLRTRVEQLPLEQLENLGEALLGFKSVPDLENWLKTT